MNPKEKSEELVGKYYLQVQTLEQQKQCGLIAVDEILSLDFNINCDATERCVNPVMNYWQQVKKEIKKL